MKKHIKNLSSITLIFFIVFGCVDLQTTPDDQITDIDTPDEVAAVLFSAYNSIYGMMGGHGNYLSLQEISSDEAVIPTRGSDWGDGGLWVRCHRHDYNPDEDYINNTWNSCYTAINQINNGFIDFEGNPGLTPEVKGELEALRTLYYFFLLDVFGNVPIITENGNQGQKPRKEVYNFVMSEINRVQPNLSTSFTIGRMNYWVLQALKTKILINKEVYTGESADWQAVVDAADDIIENGPYTFSTNYQAMFDAKNTGNREHIYAIPYDEVFAGGNNLGQMTLHYLSQQTYNSTDQPWNGYASLADFYNTYIDPEINPGPQGEVVGTGPNADLVQGTRDGRLTNFLVGPQYDAEGNPLLDGTADDPGGEPLVFTPYINELAPQAYRQAGARIGKYAFEQGFTSNLNNDKPLFRYTDVLLMKAEALFRINPDDKVALALVNQVRERAGVTSFDQLTEERLLQERGREMFFEMWRRNDQLRFGTYNDEWLFSPADPSDHVNLFPIPRVQVEGSNLQQNPGYK